MFFNKAKREFIVLLVLGLIGSGANLVVHGVKAEQPPAKPAPEPPLPPIPEQQGEQLTPIPPAKEVEVKPRPARTPKERAALLKARVVAAKKAYEGERGGLSQTRRFGNMLGSISQPETIYMWSVRWLEAERSLNPKREDQIAALEAHFKRMSELQRDVKQISKDLMPRYKEDEVEWYRLEAELWLGEAKAAK